MSGCSWTWCAATRRCSCAATRWRPPGLDRPDPRRAWEENRQDAQGYTAGTWGPSAAIALIERDGRTWHESPRSNAALLRKTLLVNDAAATRFVPLFRNEAEAAALSLDVVVLGMGTDGHTASFFPGGDTLAETIDPHTDQSLIAITAPGSGEARLTFTLPKLLAASTLCLHIEGEEKLRVLEEALSGDNAHAMPIRAVLASAQPLSLYWCP
jgi:hypothetical protein